MAQNYTEAVPPRHSIRHRFGRRLAWVAAVLLGLLLIVWIVLAFNWPFTETKVVHTLEHFSSCDVQVRRFQQTYVPHPGYVAEGVVFSRRSNGRAIEMASVRRIDNVATWMAMLTFTHRLANLRIQGLHVFIPAPVPPAMTFYPEMKDKTTVSTLIADGAVLDIAPRQSDMQPLRFDFRKLLLGNVKKEKSISLETVLQIPEPPGELAVRGQFGPFVKGRLGELPISGSYNLNHMDLSQTEKIGGILKSQGSLQGTLAHCQVRGNVRVDQFEIKTVQHPVQLGGEFDAAVDGLHGNVSMHSTKVGFLQTELQATGSVQSVQGQRGKTALLDVISDRARIEDLLRLFTKSDPPALRGGIGLHAHVVLPPGPEEFLRKLRLDGAFKISNADFQHPTTQRKVDELSERARGKKVKKDASAQEGMPSNLDAQVDLRNAIANLSHAVFKTVGAAASGDGTYNLLTEQIDLRGKLAIQASLSKAAGGMKSVFLIPLDPFFRKAHAGAVLPISVTGTYSHPSFRVSLKATKPRAKQE